MFKTLQATFKKDPDLPERAFTLAMRRRVLNDQLYDNLRFAFHQERDRRGAYIRLLDRRPSSIFNWCRTVVQDSASLLFSEAHFPLVHHDDKATRDGLLRLAEDCGLNSVFMDLAIRGSVGSAALYVRVLENRVFVEVKETTYLTPKWKATAPDTLENITELYKVKGKALKAAGYAGDYDDHRDYWLKTVWDAYAETAYLPLDVREEEPAWIVDAERTVTHDLGFCPFYWVKNLPGGDAIDGAPTFRDDAVSLQIDCDYLMSQNARGLRYGMDPQLVIKEPAFSSMDESQPIHGENSSNARPSGAGQPIVVDAAGDAKLLETSGAASDAVVSYLRYCRELAMESLGGNRASAEKLATAQSGKAMELMSQALVWLADKLRVSYGEGALKAIFVMLIALSRKFKLVHKDGSEVGQLATGRVTLVWPAWFSPTATDQQQKVETLARAVDAGLMSRETAIRQIAADYDIEDQAAELKLIEAMLAERAKSAQTQVKVTG